MRTNKVVLCAAVSMSTLWGCTATPLIQPGSKAAAATTVAEHRQRCPNGTTLKQSRYADEALKLLVCMNNMGRQHGPALMFDEGGRRTVAMNYKHGKADGPTTMWHPTGEVFVKGAYRGGVEDGRWEALAPDGSLIGEYTLTAGTGSRTRWHLNGQRQQVVRLVDGVPEGPARQWHDNGQLEMTVTFRGGQPDGPLRRFHRDGAPATEAEYRTGVLNGAEKEWWPGGKVRAVKYWRAGKLHGKSMVFDAQGGFRAAACFVDDKLVWDVNALAAAAAAAAEAKGKEVLVLENAKADQAAAEARSCP